MSIVIGTLRIDLEANTATFSEAMDKMEHLSAKTAEDVKKSLQKIAAAGIAMGAAIAGGTYEIVKHAVETIESLEHMSQSAGTTVDKLSALAYAANLVNLPTELLVKGMEKLAQASFKAQNGNAALHDIFAKLGIHVTDSNGHLKDTGELINEIAPKFARMADGAGKTALAMQLFGKGGAAMIPFLNEWGVHQEELTENARKFGLVIGPETSAKALQFAETMKNLKAAWAGFGLQLTAAALPALDAFAAKLQDIAVKANIPNLAQEFGAKLTSALQMAGNAIDFVVQHATALKFAFEALVAVRVLDQFARIGEGASGLGVILSGAGKAFQSLVGIKHLVPLFAEMAGWLRTEIFMVSSLAAEEGLASAASYVFGGALTFIAANPIAIAITALAALGAALYAYRDATFEAYNATYTWGDAFKAAFFMEGFVGNEEGLKRAKASRLAHGPVGPELDVRHDIKKPKLPQPDTSGMGKKDVFGEEIKKLDIGLVTTARYLSVLDETPEKIEAVAAAQKSQSIILELNNKLWDSQRKHLSATQVEQIRTKVAEEESLQALLAYGRALVEQERATGLSITQTRNLAKANLEGDEAMRQASIENAILALRLNKTGAELDLLTKKEPELRRLLSVKANVDVVESVNKEIYALQQEAKARQITLGAATQYTDAQREAQLAVKTLAIDQRIKNATDDESIARLNVQRQLIIDLTKAEFAEADAKEAIGLRSPIEQYAEEIRTLQRQADALALANGGTLTYGESLMVAVKQQDAFNKLTDETVKLLLRENSAGAGVKAFFLDMQKQAQTSASIIYEALHSAFDKLSDNLTELITGGKADFGKMMQDIGKQMVNQSIKSGLQKGIGAIGKAMGIDLGGALAGKPDGSSQDMALWVRMAGMAGAALPGGGGFGGDESIDDNGLYPGEDGFSGGGMLAGILGKVKGLFGGGSQGGGIFSMFSSLFGKGGGEGASSLISTLMGSLPMMAGGGDVSPDQAYLVGERGPEILMGASGSIASNSASQRMLSAPAQNHYYTIDARGTDPVLTEQRTRKAIIEAHNSAISNSLMVSQEHLKRTPQR